MRSALTTLAVLALAACGAGDEAPDEPPAAVPEAALSTSDAPRPPAPVAAGGNAQTPAAADSATEPSGPASPCLMQGSERLDVQAKRAIGTEPFWGARIEGRCVTYTHPEDQAGTRVWTRYTKRADGETWTGELGGRRFELQTRTQRDCSDGMSDKHYPLAARLIVNGEARSGCAETG